MTTPALPEDVERAVAKFAYAVRREAQEPGEPSATYAKAQFDTLLAAIAAHVAPPVSASFEDALAALDVENDYAPDRGTTYAIVGLDDVRAAHAEAVRVAVENEREACAVECDERSDRLDKHADEHGMAYFHDAAIESRECAAAIRARGAKS